jgi:integrase
MDAIAATLPPLEDREATQRVFPGFTKDGARNAMARASKLAGIPHFSPYDLRHRRTSLWHGQGLPLKELMARTGHSKSATAIDVYSHVLADKTELTAEELLPRCGPGVVSEDV